MRREMTWQVRRLISAPVVNPSRWPRQWPAATATGAPQGVQNPQAVVGQRSAVSAVRAADIDPPALTEGQPGDSHVLAIG